MRAGLKIADACKAAGVVERTYGHWRERDKEFAHKASAAIRVGRGLSNSGPQVGKFKGDFAAFSEHILGYPLPSLHQKIIETMENAVPGRITLINMQPEGGKTTLFTNFITYQHSMDPNLRIGYVHESQQEARKVLQQIATRFTADDNPRWNELQALYGPFHDRDKSWTADHYQLAKTTHDQKDYSLQVFGITGAVQGTRLDRLYVDDVQRRHTLNLTEARVGNLRQDFLSRVGRGGTIAVCMARVGEGDVTEALLADEELATLIDHYCFPALDDRGNPTLPELWTAAELDIKRKQVGEQAWWRNYMQRPLGGRDATFTQEMWDLAKSPVVRIRTVPREVPAVVTLDPALGGGNAVCTLSYTEQRICPVDLSIDYGLARFEDIVAAVATHAGRYQGHVTHVVIEKETMQGGFARMDAMIRLQRRYGFEVVEHVTRHNKSNPLWGVSAMPLSFRRGEIVIPMEDEGVLEPLRTQLLAWRPDVWDRGRKVNRGIVFDAGMAFWFGWTWWMNWKEGMQVNADAFKFTPASPLVHRALQTRQRHPYPATRSRY